MRNFKFGDKVVRVKAANGGYAKVGQEAVVKSVEPCGGLRVYYEGCADDRNGCEFWLHCCTELVEEPTKASEICRFVPGNTYKSRDGKNTYTFIGYCAELPENSRAVFALLRNKDSALVHAITVNRSADGTYRHRDCAHLDIMFEETVWVNLYRIVSSGMSFFRTNAYASKEAGEKHGREMRHDDTVVYVGTFPVTING